MQRQASQAQRVCTGVNGPRVVTFVVWFDPETGHAASVVAQPMSDGQAPNATCAVNYIRRAEISPFLSPPSPVKAVVVFGE